MGWPCGLGGHMSWAVVSAQPAVHGVAPPHPGHFRGSFCTNRASLFSDATAAGPCKLPPATAIRTREASLRARRGTPYDRLVWGCDGLRPWEGSQPGPGWLAMGPRVLGPGRGSGEGGQESQESRVRGS